MTKLSENKKAILENRKKLVWDSLFYSNQRLDLLIISISGGGLYTCSEIIKYLLDNNKPIDTLLKIIMLLFILAIIFNVISQKTSSKVHEFDFLSLEIQLDEEMQNKEVLIDENKDEYEKKIDEYDSLTKILNEFSLVFMFSALLIFILYISVTF